MPGPAKRRPPRFDPLSPHGIRIAIVRKLVSPVALEQKGAWARELCILKKLQRTCPDDAFWLSLSPALPLESLAWFLSEFGAAALKEQWDLHVFGKAQETQQMEIDSRSSKTRMETSTDEIELDLPALKPKKTVLQWVDS